MAKNYDKQLNENNYFNGTLRVAQYTKNCDFDTLKGIYRYGSAATHQQKEAPGSSLYLPGTGEIRYQKRQVDRLPVENEQISFTARDVKESPCENGNKTKVV